MSHCASALPAAETPSRQQQFQRLAERAEALADRPYQPSPGLPSELRDLDYDQYRLIAFEHERAIWKAAEPELPFWLECFHRGYLYRDQVALHLVEDGEARPLAFDARLFQYRGALAGLSPPAETGFAGFRVLGKFASSPHKLEIASFLGASYFRAIGAGQVYGTSARGLAVDMGLPKAEEFPVFRAFWIERPAPNATALRVWALLDSESVAGAYALVLRPGETTTVDVRARLYFRRRPEKLGLAPLTSMWMWGDGRAAPADDPRDQVHDADGLLVETQDGEWIWRPLARLDYPSLSHYDLAGIRGFGLLQRNRDAKHYRDDEARYHQRPSVWIEPQQVWTEGAVELLELPAEHEGIDNIAAWWLPKTPVDIDKPLDLAYRVSFLAGDPPGHDTGRATRLNVERGEGQPLTIEIDFTSPALRKLKPDAPPTPRVTAQRGRVERITCQKLPHGAWRVRFDVHPDGDQPVELTAVLEADGRALTETWRYLCPK